MNPEVIQEVPLKYCCSLLAQENKGNWLPIKKKIVSGAYRLFKVCDSYLVLEFSQDTQKQKHLTVITGVALSTVLPVINAMKSFTKNLGYGYLIAFACRDSLGKVYLDNGFAELAREREGISYVWRA